MVELLDEHRGAAGRDGTGERRSNQEAESDNGDDGQAQPRQARNAKVNDAAAARKTPTEKAAPIPESQHRGYADLAFKRPR